jgi:hypothetical protein
MKRLLIISAIATLLSGCATSPESMAHRSNLDICQSYGVFSASPLWAARAQSHRDELIRRKALTNEEWTIVQQRSIRIGMSQCALYASWGRPDRSNRSVAAGGVVIQHVYNAGYRHIRPRYVYTRDGTVTGWQD